MPPVPKASSLPESAADAPADAWQRAVDGVWHGLPACFLPDGRPLGFLAVERAVLSRPDGDLEIVVHSRPQAFTDPRWAERLRFPADRESFRVHNDGPSRIYLGPDCHGVGQPFGTCTLGHDHQRPWSAENQIVVLLHPGRDHQTYSNILRNSLRCELVLHGLYLRTPADWADHPEHRDRVAAHLAAERHAALAPPPPFTAPERWSGSLELHAADQQPVGRCHLELLRAPLSPTRERETLDLRGPLALHLTSELEHTPPDAHHCGDLVGSALQLGRARYTSAIARRDGLRLERLEYRVDTDTRSLCWQLFRGLRLEHVLHGQLTRQP